MTGKNLLAGICFTAGLSFAVLGALHHSHHGGHHDDHSHRPAETTFDILKAPLATLNGSKTTLGASAPALRLVNFWATWCTPCRQEMPLLDKAANIANVPFVGIAVDQTTLVKKFISEKPVTYDIFTSSFDIFYFFQNNDNKTGIIPYTVLLDNKGNIKASKLGEFHSVEEILTFIESV